MIVIWHNPRCGKSRAALDLLNAAGAETQIVEYLKTPPTAEEIRATLAKLGLPAGGLIRTREPVCKELNLGVQTGEDALIAAMAAHPILIERAVVINGERAVIARPPEKVHQLL